MSRITVAEQPDGTQIWTNTANTGEVILYLFKQKAVLRAGDRIEAMANFRRRLDGGVERGLDEPARVLTAPDIAAIPAGSFVRCREAEETLGAAARSIKLGR